MRHGATSHWPHHLYRKALRSGALQTWWQTTGTELSTYQLAMIWIRWQGNLPNIPGKPKQAAWVTFERLVEESSILTQCPQHPLGPYSKYPLWKQQSRAVVRRSRVAFIVATLKSSGGSQMWKGPSSWRRRPSRLAWSAEIAEPWDGSERWSRASLALVCAEQVGHTVNPNWRCSRVVEGPSEHD